MLQMKQTVSPQAQAVYKTLAKGNAMCAQQIAEELGILPNGVYRVAKKLADLGLVEELGGYPARFQAMPALMALNLFMVATTQNFRREFGLAKPDTMPKRGNEPTISLIKDRPAMLRRGAADARAARPSIDWIVSGHQVPDDTVLAYRQAATRGVAMRMIVHQKPQLQQPQLNDWKAMGAATRYLPDFKLRLLIFDQRIVYLTSFDPKRPGSAFGVRFAYEPLALQISQLFEQNWQRAKVV